MSNLLETLTVKAVKERERKDGTGTFPVVILEGVSFTMSSSGNTSLNKREVSMILSGFTIEEAKAMFPVKTKLSGWKIERYEVDPYTFEVLNEETGEMETLESNIQYRAVEISSVTNRATQEAQAPKSTTEPAPAPSEVGTDA